MSVLVAALLPCRPVSGPLRSSAPGRAAGRGGLPASHAAPAASHRDAHAVASHGAVRAAHAGHAAAGEAAGLLSIEAPCPCGCDRAASPATATARLGSFVAPHLDALEPPVGRATAWVPSVALAVAPGRTPDPVPI
jgi:hypothetical protein